MIKGPLDVRIGGQSLRPLLNGAPKIGDQLNAVCRTLDLSIQNADGLRAKTGNAVELWYGGERWFYGFIRKKNLNDSGAVSFSVYDPLFLMGKNPDDWYFKNETATQAFRKIAAQVGIKVASLANTGVVLAPLYYQGAEADKVATDLLARTHEHTKRRFWYRYQPDYGSDGLALFEKKLPSKIWAFQTGVNLLSAEYEENAEDIITVVKLINRDSGKVVTRVNTDALKQYGQSVYFEEIDKDKAPQMERMAREYLDKLSKLTLNVKGEGLNPDQQIPQLFAGDAIYVQERATGLVGGYYIRNITQEFVSDYQVRIAFEVTAAPDLPEVQVDDAADKAKEKEKAESGGSGQTEEYSPETKALMEKYGI